MRKVVIIFIALSVAAITAGQSNIIFHHLNTANGLSYLGVNDICTDKKGNLWVATGNGLNRFDGKTIDKYFASEYPQLQSSNILLVDCDSSNRIWVLTQGGNLTLLDEKRQLHRVALYDEGKPIRILSLLRTPSGQIHLYTSKGNFIIRAGTTTGASDSLTNRDFLFLPILDYDQFKMKGGNIPFSYDKDHYMLVYKDAILLVRYSDNRAAKILPVANARVLSPWGKQEVLYYDMEEAQLKAFNLRTQSVRYPLRGLKDQHGKEIVADITSAGMVSNRQAIFTTANDGIFIFDTTAKSINNYRHTIDDPSSVSNNMQTNICVGQKGWVFLVCNPSGISYYNTRDFIGNKQVFTDGKGKGFDGYVSGIATPDNNTYYIGTAEGMMEWKRNTNSTVFIDFKNKEGKSVFGGEEVYSIVIDKYKRIWATTMGQGIVVMDPSLRLVKHIEQNGPSKPGLKISRLSQLLVSPDGSIWACGNGGIAKINPDTWEINNLSNTALARFDSLFCSPFLLTDKDNLWFAAYSAASTGFYHYSMLTDKVEEITALSGANNPGIFCLNADREKNIYVGTRKGLKIYYTSGRIKTITQKEGLLIDRAEGLLLDDHDRMWIGNDIGLACYDPADSSLRTFDERYGLSIYGFRVGSYFQTPNGEFIFGTPKGLQYFHPDSMFNKKISLDVSITKIETKNSTITITGNESFRLAAANNQVTFHFGTVDYSPHLRTYYEYRLEGLDKEWTRLADQNFVRYNSLPPGEYTFKVRVSNDGNNWQDAANEIKLIIATPFHKTWWFKLLGILVCLLIIGLVINYYRKQQEEKRSRLETELVITYFASQINSHNNTDDLLWDVARNCISKLHFEDCVIYLKDESGKNLVQKAAYGPKNAVDFTIHQPILIPVGSGITGTVAQTGKPEIVNDTESDSRYIEDDERRLSEIAVPIFINNKVVGVIDSEHPQKNFFTQRHLTILQTIAALCANQIQKTKAEEERRMTTIELLENKQKAAESRLQSLRLQMNPHFLFNALNSVQQMILANEEMVATKYLSRFSKLLRAVLIHSDKETITLKEEIEILKMYVELESVRFRDAFSYSITCDEGLETEEIKIPTLLVQPFVENAIWHGLMHKEGDRFLTISFSEQDDMLQCIIEDNGVGRKKAREIGHISGQDKKHTSKGIAVSEERLKTLKNTSGKYGSILINDLESPSGEGLGTQVIINFPV